MWFLRLFDRALLIAILPSIVVGAVALVRRAQPSLWPYVLWAFWSGVWGVWWLLAPQMLVVFAVGVLVGWATVGRARRLVLGVRRRIAGTLLRWANELDPDRPWSRTL